MGPGFRQDDTAATAPSPYIFTAWGLLMAPIFWANRAPKAAPWGAFCCCRVKSSQKQPFPNEKAHHEMRRRPRIEDRPVLFIAKEAAPKTGIAPDAFWAGLAAIIKELGPKNRALLAVRDTLQAKIDDSAPRQQGQGVRPQRLYRVPEGDHHPRPGAGDAEGRHANVDEEIGTICAAARRAPDQRTLTAPNAADARWGSLYDAFSRHRRHPARSVREARATTRRAATR